MTSAKMKQTTQKECITDEELGKTLTEMKKCMAKVNKYLEQKKGDEANVPVTEKLNDKPEETGKGELRVVTSSVVFNDDYSEVNVDVDGEVNVDVDESEHEDSDHAHKQPEEQSSEDSDHDPIQDDSEESTHDNDQHYSDDYNDVDQSSMSLRVGNGIKVKTEMSDSFEPDHTKTMNYTKSFEPLNVVTRPKQQVVIHTPHKVISNSLPEQNTPLKSSNKSQSATDKFYRTLYRIYRDIIHSYNQLNKFKDPNNNIILTPYQLSALLSILLGVDESDILIKCEPKIHKKFSDGRIYKIHSINILNRKNDKHADRIKRLPDDFNISIEYLNAGSRLMEFRYNRK